MGTLSVERPTVVKTLVEILGGWEKEGLRVEGSTRGKVKVVLGAEEVTKLGLRTLEMDISCETSVSRGEIFTDSAVPRAGKAEGGDSRKSIEEDVGMILLGIIPDLLL